MLALVSWPGGMVVASGGLLKEPRCAEAGCAQKTEQAMNAQRPRRADPEKFVKIDMLMPPFAESESYPRPVVIASNQ
jgi:hypothetical protein